MSFMIISLPHVRHSIFGKASGDTLQKLKMKVKEKVIPEYTLA